MSMVRVHPTTDDDVSHAPPAPPDATSDPEAILAGLTFDSLCSCAGAAAIARLAEDARALSNDSPVVRRRAVKMAMLKVMYTPVILENTDRVRAERKDHCDVLVSGCWLPARMWSMRLNEVLAKDLCNRLDTMRMLKPLAQAQALAHRPQSTDAVRVTMAWAQQVVKHASAQYDEERERALLAEVQQLRDRRFGQGRSTIDFV